MYNCSMIRGRNAIATVKYAKFRCKFPLCRVRILPHVSSTPCYMCMHTREGCGLGLHVLPYIYTEYTTIRARVANRRYLNLMLLRFLQLCTVMQVEILEYISVVLTEYGLNVCIWRKFCVVPSFGWEASLLFTEAAS